MAVLKIGSKNLFTQEGDNEPYINNNINFDQILATADYPIGHVLQTKYVEKTDRQAIVGAQNIYGISGLSIAITPTSYTNEFILVAMITHSATYVSSFGFLKDGVAFGGNNNTNTNNSVTTLYWGQSAAGDFCWTTTVIYRDLAANAFERTYQVAACSSWGGSTGYTLNINDRGSDMLSTSTFMVMEIKK